MAEMFALKRWRRRPVSWKNLLCTCGLWIDRARIVEHTHTPFHLDTMAQRAQAVLMKATAVARATEAAWRMRTR